MLHLLFHIVTAQWEYRPEMGIHYRRGIDFSTFEEIDTMVAFFECVVCERGQWQRVGV